MLQGDATQMKFQFPKRKPSQPLIAKLPAKRLNSALEDLFPLCFVPEASLDAARISVDLPSAGERARR